MSKLVWALVISGAVVGFGSYLYTQGNLPFLSPEKSDLEITDKETGPTEGAGVQESAPDEANIPADVQAFYNECKAKGGISPGPGGKKERLPTTESGYTCWYQNRTCWDFLTYSRERYMGGAPGCPELNLLPQVVPIPFANVVGQWQGNGSLNFSGSQYCNTYSIPWSATLQQSGTNAVTGTVYDDEQEAVGTLTLTWDAAGNRWQAVLNSDIFTLTNLGVTGTTIGGNITIKAAWLPCDDITGQTGTFNGGRI